MKLVDKQIKVSQLKEMSEKMFGGLVKVVVDIDQKIMVVDADLHADEEFFLLENGSEQKNLWGINIFPEKFGAPDFIVFDSMINLRPSWGNKTRGVEDPKIQQIIINIVNNLVIL